MNLQKIVLPSLQNAARHHLIRFPTISKIKNGMRVATEGHYNASRTASVGLWIDSGSRYENEKNNGVAHFLEHMAFKGTNRRTRQQLELEIENMGAHLNAYTSREQTLYFAQVLREDVGNAVDILSDIILNSQYNTNSIEIERSVILREMEEVESDSQELIFDKLHLAAFPGSALSRPILGPVKNINSIRRKDLVDFVKQHYIGPRMVLTACGGVDHATMCSLAEEKFSALNDRVFTANEASYKDALHTPFAGHCMDVVDGNISTAHFAVAFKGLSWTDSDYFGMLALQQLMGNWDIAVAAPPNTPSTLAFSRMSGSEVLQPFNNCYYDTGLFGARVVTAPHSVIDSSRLLLNTWARFMASLTDAETDLAKQLLKTSLVTKADDSVSRMEELGWQTLVYGRRMPPQEVVARIDALSPATLQHTAQRLFASTPAVVCMLPPHLPSPGPSASDVQAVFAQARQG